MDILKGCHVTALFCSLPHLEVFPLLRKHEAMVMTVGPVCELQLRLMRLVLAEQHRGLRSNRDRSTLPVFQ
jgi:hypothetical protein